MDSQQNKISVLIPAFNEEDNIMLTVKETIDVFDDLGKDYEVIIIDDGSHDDTYHIVSKALGQLNGRVRIEKYMPNQGKGFAVKHGFNFVSGNYVLFLDADLDLHPSHITDFLKLMEENDADVVMGSKRHKDSIVVYSFFRRMCYLGYYFLIRILFNIPVKDTQTGFKLFRYKALKAGIQKIVVKKYAFDLELLVVLNKYKFKIVEGPVFLKPTRKYGRIGMKDIFYVLWDTLAIFYRLYVRINY